MADPSAIRNLRQQFQSRLDQLAQRSLNPETGPTAAEIESLASLSKLCDMAEASARRSISAWQLLALLGLILAVLTVLFFVEMPSTAISGKVTASNVTFAVAEDTPLSKGWAGLSSVGVSEASQIQFPALGKDPEGTVANAALSIEGAITLAPLAVPAGTRISISALPAGAYRVQLQSNPTKSSRLAIQVNATGQLRVKGLDRPPGEFQLARPAAFVATGDQALTFDFTAPSAAVAFQALLPANQLEFREAENVGEGSSEHTRIRSTLNSGSLYFESLGAREYKLREAEDLDVSQFVGTIRSLSLKDGAITVNFEGVAGQLKSHKRSLKPSILDFLQAQKPVELLWGSALGLFGAVLAALRWFKVNV